MEALELPLLLSEQRNFPCSPPPPPLPLKVTSGPSLGNGLLLRPPGRSEARN